MPQIATTHAGSLPRPPLLDELHAMRSRGQAIDEDELIDLTERATADVVRRQIETGLDIVNDGEQGRESFFTYVRWRMSGFSGVTDRPVMADMRDYPDYLELKMAGWKGRPAVSLLRPPAATAAVAYTGLEALDAELDRFGRALPDDHHRSFVTSPSPGIVAAAMEDRFYGDIDRYVNAVADALAVEYRAILDAGHTLQIDAPDLAMERHTSFADRPLDDFRSFATTVIAAIDRVLPSNSRDRVRLHVCWGNYDGPHTRDVELDEMIDLYASLDVDGLLLSMANPRHAHDHASLARTPLPASITLLAGVIDTTTNYVEHPEVVAQRITSAVETVGDPERVIAATDCGFATSAGTSMVATEVAWTKLASLVEGAAIASARL